MGLARGIAEGECYDDDVIDRPDDGEECGHQIDGDSTQTSASPTASLARRATLGSARRRRAVAADTGTNVTRSLSVPSGQPGSQETKQRPRPGDHHNAGGEPGPPAHVQHSSNSSTRQCSMPSRP